MKKTRKRVFFICITTNPNGGSRRSRHSGRRRRSYARNSLRSWRPMRIP